MEETETLTARENLILRNESCVLRSLTLLSALLSPQGGEEGRGGKAGKKNKKREKLNSELCLCDSVVVLLQQTQILDM